MRDQQSARSEKGLRGRKRWLWTALSYALGAGCLFWVFHNIPFHDLLNSLASVTWGWIPAAIALDLLIYIVAGWEWQLLVRPAGELSLGKSIQAVFAGRFANDILPVHVGYVVRLCLVSRWTRQPVAVVVPSLLVERFLDSLWLAVGIGLTVLFFPLPPKFVRMGEAIGAAILVSAALAGWMILRREKPKGSPRFAWFMRWRLPRGLRTFATRVAEGVRSIGRSELVFAAAGLSVAKLALQVGMFLMLVWAYGFQFSVRVFLAVFVVAYAGISMPSTPASVGVFQLFCVAGLKYFGVSKPAASGFALLAFVVMTAPLSLGGVIALAQSGLTWRQVREQARAPNGENATALTGEHPPGRAVP